MGNDGSYLGGVARRIFWRIAIAGILWVLYWVATGHTYGN